MGLLRAQAALLMGRAVDDASAPPAMASQAARSGAPRPGPPAAASRRAMTVADLDTVVQIEAGAYSFPWSRGNFCDSLAAGYAAEVLEHPDAGIVGYFVAMQGVDELHLLNITVAPAWQCAGRGSLLLDAVEQLAQRRGLATVWLEVRDTNQRAQALYGRRGFVAVGRRRGYYPAAGRREDAIVMCLRLQPSPRPAAPAAGNTASRQP